MLIHRGVDLHHAEFGLWVNGHGNPSRPASGSTVEWEGTAKRAAHHHPYVLLFDSRFIEIRSAETDRLVQIIPGNDIRCIWDGSGADGGIDHKARVHVVMNAPEQASLDGRRDAGSAVESQQVVELIPLPDSGETSDLSGYACALILGPREAHVCFFHRQPSHRLHIDSVSVICFVGQEETKKKCNRTCILLRCYNILSWFLLKLLQVDFQGSFGSRSRDHTRIYATQRHA
jgi:hypothetical protein